MSPCNTCTIGNNRFEFSTDRLTLQNARTRCTAQNGGLANNLNRNTYTKLNRECCTTSSQQFFWIDLTSNKNCSASNGGAYSWRYPTSCENGLPLMVNQHPAKHCQGVSLQLKTPRQDIPQAQVQDCSTQLRYICQFRIEPTRPPVRPSPPPATPTTPKPKVTTVKTTSTETTIRNTKQSSTNMPPTSESTATTMVTSNNLPSIYGAIIGGIFILLLLAIAAYFLYKKGSLRNLKTLRSKKRIVSTRSASSYDTQNQVHNHVYFSVEPTIELYQTVNSQSKEQEESHENVQTNSVDNKTYLYTQDTSDQHEYEHLKGSTKVNGVNHYENEEVDQYNKLYFHERASTKLDNGKQSPQNHSSKNYQQEQQPDITLSETVEYTTVRSINEPLNPYASIDKCYTIG